MISVLVIQLCPYSVKASVNNTLINGYDGDPINFFNLEKEAARWI